MGRRSWSKEQTHSPVSVSSIWPAETGVVARLAAPLLGSKWAVTAIDLNPTMLSVGRAAAEGEGSGHRMATGAGRAAALRRLQFRPRALL